MFKPDGYTSVSPYLTVEGADATIAFLAKAFGATELRCFRGDGDRVVHAEVRLDDSVIMLSDGQPGADKVASHVHIYVENVDEVYQRALDAGAASVQAPVQQGDPDKRGGVTFGGITWWVSTMVDPG